MQETLEYFFSFRSPYSYISGPRAFDLLKKYDIQMVWRGVRPMAMRGQPLPRSKQFYILRDTAREADRLGMPFGKIYDPLGEGVWRCLTIAEHAKSLGKLPEFVLAASRASWAEGIDVAQAAPLRAICEQTGLDWKDSSTAIATADFRQRVEVIPARLSALVQLVVPTFLYLGEAFWGQDRIQDLEAVLTAAGLAAPNAGTIAK